MDSNKTFGEAIQALNEGKRVSREGWNGKGMFIFQRPSNEVDVWKFVDYISVPKSVRNFFTEREKEKHPSEQWKTKIKFGAYLCMYAADGSVVSGWMASQTDILANDWCILD